MSDSHAASLKSQVIAALKTCYDPEIPVDIYELGLVYDLITTHEGAVHVRMTLTTPNCPVADHLPRSVEAKLRSIPGVTDVKVELVWDPPWDRSRMSDVARLALGFDLPPRDMVPTERLGS
jgi:FeS assembly SUF system protein